MRLDQYIVEKKEITRNKAQAMIKAGNINVNEVEVTKTGYNVRDNDIVEIVELEETKYVARSAVKLKYYLEDDKVDISGKVCLDIGSSTGGFCQILLENNASKVYAVDVGTSQLHDKVKNEPKIVSIENTDIRLLGKLEEKIDIITCDVSFISLDVIIDSIISHMSDETIGLILFKPQFEVGKENVVKGVVKNERKIAKRLDEFLQTCRDKGLKIHKVEKSKLEGEKGNKEIIIKITKK